MSTYSVAEAKAKLSALINEALEGEGVVITRHGQPVVEIKPVARRPGPITKEDIDWLRKRRASRKTGLNAGVFVSKMRDEEWM